MCKALWADQISHGGSGRIFYLSECVVMMYLLVFIQRADLLDSYSAYYWKACDKEKVNISGGNMFVEEEKYFTKCRVFSTSKELSSTDIFFCSRSHKTLPLSAMIMLSTVVTVEEGLINTINSWRQATCYFLKK